ncbi:hypothetical protein [Winogradskyella sp. PG-2]|uniref:hypothetical protein n=1 Tax=Winogradskyella sp. PG-2 TaxID=754409 RepID=UPI001E4BB4D9|nr:hypothetical protein [Winogradskyella sp. PG-2]
MAIISAPSIIMSFDDTIDITCFYGENEEEEKESLKLLFEISTENLEDFFVYNSSEFNNKYAFKSYSKPHLNLVLPPPEFI